MVAPTIARAVDRSHRVGKGWIVCTGDLQMSGRGTAIEHTCWLTSVGHSASRRHGLSGAFHSVDSGLASADYEIRRSQNHPGVGCLVLHPQSNMHAAPNEGNAR